MNLQLPTRDLLEHADWINARIAAQVRRRRDALGRTAYALAIPRILTAQTIRNIETETHSPTVRTLGLLSLRLETTFEKLVGEALEVRL